MSKQKKSSASIVTVKTKIEEAINNKIDNQIDKIMDKTFKSIEEQEKEEKRKLTKRPYGHAPKENKNEKIVFALSYFLFFISLIFSKSQERKFYANQGLMLLIFAVVGAVFFRVVVGLIHYETSIILSVIFYIFVCLCATFGFVKTLTGEKNVQIPLIGKIKLIK